MSNSRIRKKKRKKSFVFYDIKSLPWGMTPDKMLEHVRRKGVVIYSSINGGEKPSIFPKKNTKYFNIKEDI